MREKITVQEINEMIAQGFQCSQVVFGYGAQKVGMDKDLALKLSAGMGGGYFHGEVCGAVSGVVATLGLVYGFSLPNSTQQKEILSAKVKEFEKRFTEENKSLVCRELLGGYDFADPESSVKKYNIDPAKAFKNCTAYCKFACDLLDELM